MAPNPQPPLTPDSLTDLVNENRARGEDQSVSQALEMMGVRGIDNPGELLAFASAERIIATCAWWDSRVGAGPGVLASRIRAGGIDAPAPKRGQQSTLERQHAYGESIITWLQEKLPDLCAADGQPHPAAIAAVIRLHHQHGKGRLTVGEHAAEIRESVRRFERLMARWDAEANDAQEQAP